MLRFFTNRPDFLGDFSQIDAGTRIAFVGDPRHVEDALAITRDALVAAGASDILVELPAGEAPTALAAGAVDVVVTTREGTAEALIPRLGAAAVEVTGVPDGVATLDLFEPAGENAVIVRPGTFPDFADLDGRPVATLNSAGDFLERQVAIEAAGAAVGISFSQIIPVTSKTALATLANDEADAIFTFGAEETRRFLDTAPIALATIDDAPGLFLSPVDPAPSGPQDERRTFGGTDLPEEFEGGDNLDRIRGFGGDDTLRGGDGADLIDGGADDDQIFGEGGDDFLNGGTGNDVIDGGPGMDRVAFGASPEFFQFVRFGAVTAVIGPDQEWSGGAFREPRTDAVAVDLVRGVEEFGFDGGVVSPPEAEFDALAYIASHPDLVAALGVDAQAGFEHFAFFGSREGRAVSFDGIEYIAGHADLIAAFGADAAAGARHFMQNGLAEGRAADAFDALGYLAAHPDLIAAFGADRQAAARHYITDGFAEGRATGGFDGLRYIASHADLIAAFGPDARAGMQHYVMDGFAEGRATAAFDGLAYIAAHPDLIAAFGADAAAGVAHFIAHGFAEGRAARFDGLDYIASHPDLVAAFGTDVAAGARHFIDHGFTEGRAADAFDETQYLANHSDVATAGLDPALHFIQFGLFEGRTDDILG